MAFGILEKALVDLFGFSWLHIHPPTHLPTYLPNHPAFLFPSV